MPSFVLPDALKHLDMLPVLLGFGVTVIVTWLLCRLSKVLSIGHDSAKGVQKFHVNPTSRLGGVAIFLGLAVSGLAVPGIAEFQHYSFWFLLAAMPVWLAGLTEDLTRRVGPTLRLVMATLSAAWLFGSLGVSVNRTDVWPIDLVLSIPGAPFCVTLLVVAGFTHSVNIVDGFHGLASGLAMIALSSLAFMAWKVGDTLLLQMCLTSLAVVLGFFVLNWPRGAIFLGDAGAYLIGFWVVELGILLATRNPQISPMAPVVVGLLPLIETLFSMYRRNVLRSLPVNKPDALHLHSLIYRRLLFKTFFLNSPDQKIKMNSRVALYFWIPATFFSSISCAFMQFTLIQLALMVAYLAMYIWLYKRLVKFKSPAFMKREFFI
jgi:UDP-N-acetylmuramyl pentapeptide phosphotransferase/UDP-N-acetylglucosamine-1-phosphate transferase